MKSQTLSDIWEKDSKINKENLEESLFEIPSIHAKYIHLLLVEKREIALAKAKLNKLNIEKFEFYTDGEYQGAPKEWVRPPKGGVNKNQAQPYIDADTQIQEETLKISAISDRIDFLNEVIRQINSRNFIIKNIIELRKLGGETW